MSRRLTNFTLLLIWLLAGCDSGGFAPRGPITLAFTVQPASAVASAAISPVVITVQDAHGNTLSSASTSIAMEIGSNPASGTLAGQTTVAAVQGVATFSNLSIDKSGSGYTLTAHANGATGATSSSFDVTPAPKKLAFSVQPKPSQVGHAISPAVEVAVQDLQGETVAGASTTVTIVIAPSSGGGRFSGTITVPTVNGVATFSDLIIDTPGYGYTLLAYAEGLGVATSDPFTIWVPFVVSGAVTGATADGVLITLSGAMSGTTTTVGGGLYLFFGLLNGNYTLTPSKSGYLFNPPSIAVTVNGGNVTGRDFTAFSAGPYSISGAVSGAIPDGVLITLSGTVTSTTTTAGGGLYSFSGLPNGSYTVTPSKAGYSFNPPSIAVTVKGGNVTGRNFVSTICSSLWTSVPSGWTDYLWDVWGSGPNDVWAVGGSVPDYPCCGAILHWDGSTWTSALSSAPPDGLFGVWGSGPNDVWAVGGSFSDSATIMHWNGSAWTEVPSGATASFFGVWGSGPNDVWAVGEGRTPTILHWNGSTWTAGSSVDGTNLVGVWGSGANDVWAVGVSGTIVHWNGSTWTAVASGTTDNLSGVWGSRATDVWVVGGAGEGLLYPDPSLGPGGTILHWNGSAWSSVASGTTENLNRVWGSGANDVWAVGDSGAIVHWDGSAWSSVSSCVTNALSGVWESGPSEVWAVGSPGVILERGP